MIVGDEEIGGQNGTAYLVELGYDCAFFLAGERTHLKIGNRAKGVARLELIARGRSAHAARPWEGESAVEVMMRAYPAIRAAFPLPETHTPEATASLTVISGGDAVNRLPAECQMLADIRYPESESLRAAVDELKEEWADMPSLFTFQAALDQFVRTVGRASPM